MEAKVGIWREVVVVYFKVLYHLRLELVLKTVKDSMDTFTFYHYTGNNFLGIFSLPCMTHCNYL
jgi:hypothetical protein